MCDKDIKVATPTRLDAEHEYYVNITTNELKTHIAFRVEEDDSIHILYTGKRELWDGLTADCSNYLMETIWKKVRISNIFESRTKPKNIDFISLLKADLHF